MYIFISHSSKDYSIAQELCNILETNGSNCFLAPRDIRPGYEYANEIINGIDRSNAMLLLLSNNATSSPHILREIERAVSKSIPIIVYKLEDVVLTKSYEYFLMSHQWLDAECCRYDILLKSIKDLENDSPVADTASTVSVSTASPAATHSGTKGNKKMFPFIIGMAIIISLSVALGISISHSTKDDNINSNNTVYNIINNNDNNETSDRSTTKDTSDTSTEATEESSANITNSDNIKLGDTIILGKYNNADIVWKVLKISDDGTKAILISKDILTFKAFDGAKGGEYKYIDNKEDFELAEYSSGSNSWQCSTIRTWLNSDSDYVKYDGQAPTDQAMSDGCNGYDMEPGFLYGFTEQELSAITETNIETKGNVLTDINTITTTDRVFLLSSDELAWFDEAGVSLLSIPTSEAVIANESPYYTEYCQGVFKVDSAQWWLRDPLENSSTECYQVSHGAKTDEKICTSIACADGYGIRPAITVDLTSDVIKVSK